MRRMDVIFVAALTAFSSSGRQPASVAGLTARAQLPQVIAAAKKWRSDAALTHVSSLTVSADGTAKNWLYTFYAPQTKKSLIVTAAVGTALDTLEVPNTSKQPIGDAWVDSDKAMQTAKQNGLKGTDPSMGLVVMGETGPPTWAVNGGVEKGDVSVMLDGKTGAFIRRQVIP